MQTITQAQVHWHRLPPELLCHVLVYLHGYDLIRVRQTCRAMKALVDNSEMLQYFIDLYYFQMIQVDAYEANVPLTTRCEQLRQHDAAWQNFQYKQKCTLPFPMSPATHIVGGIYGSVRGNNIHFARLPSVFDPDDIHSWSHPVDIITFVDFTFCPEQDLLIVVNAALNEDEDRAYDIHLRSLTTNETHPDAAQSILKALDMNVINADACPERPLILGTYISLLVRSVIHRGTNGDYMQMLDWKSENGYRFILWFGEGINDYSFLAEDKFLVVTNGMMEIYSIADKSKAPQCTARLSLPSLMDDWIYIDVFSGINPIPCSVFPYSGKSPHQPSCFFHPSGDDQLVVIRIHVVSETDGGSRRYFFFARRSGILQLESLFANMYNQPISNGPSLPWSAWGPQHTTWFNQRHRQWQHSLYGFRTAGIYGNSSDWSRMPSRLFIRDFNPHIHRGCNARDTAGWRSRVVRGELTTVIRPPFMEPLGSALSYREIVSQELFNMGGILMDESRIILQKRAHLGSQTAEALIF